MTIRRELRPRAIGALGHFYRLFRVCPDVADDRPDLARRQREQVAIGR